MYAFNWRRRLQLFCLLASLLSNVVAVNPNRIGYVRHRRSLKTLSAFTQRIMVRSNTIPPLKEYSGNRLSNSSLLMVYHHDLTVAITELGPAKLLLSCELIEINHDSQREDLLQELSKLNKPLEIKFDEMIKLMVQCEYVDKLYYATQNQSGTIETSTGGNGNSTTIQLAASLFPLNPLSLFSGIVPGTKWCGTGDIAQSYHDLGTETNMDRCCRQHDFCPKKIHAYETKYGLTNDALYTKSHCVCDDLFFACLKKVNTSASQLTGSVFFNFVKVSCIEGNSKNFRFRAAKEGF